MNDSRPNEPVEQSPVRADPRDKQEGTQPDETRQTTPADAGYRWPAEWEPHVCTWLSWPHNRDTWPGKFDAIPPAYAKMVQTITRFEPVHILAGGSAWDECRDWVARELRSTAFPIELHPIPTNDAWIRDHGPTFLARGPEADEPADLPPALIDWEYNAWGGKYPPFDLDNEVPGKIAQLLDSKRFAPGIVLEGGSIEGDGLGTILTTRTCLLHPGRNPGLDQQAVEHHLRQQLNAKQILWLSGDGIAGDDTDGHIDQLARFARPGVILAARESDPEDENFAPLEKLWQELATLRDARGEPMQCIELPTPAAQFVDGHRLPTSYCNFYFVNGGVIIPHFRDPRADAAATEIFQQAFPEREVVPVDMLDLVWGLGAIHCLTQQQCAEV